MEDNHLQKEHPNKGKIPWNKGKKGLQTISKDGKIAISKRMKGNKFAKRVKWTNERRKKYSGMMKLSWEKGKFKNKSGKDAKNWKGGITPINAKIRSSKEYRLWRTAVFERDNYTCIWCGQVGNDLNADHIKPFALYPELRFAIDNGRTLCLKCHKTTDTYAGKTRI